MSATSGSSVERNSDTSKKIVTSAERHLYIKPLMKLKQQENILVKGLISAIENMKIDSNLLQDIVHDHRELSLKREAFVNSIYKSMTDITSEMDSVKHIANNPEELQKLDVNKYKLKLIKLKQKMQDFEESCPIQTLTQEKDDLDTELHKFASNLKKFENVQKNVAILSPTCQTKIDNKKEKVEYHVVDDFHTLIATTGHTENWAMEDHLFFLKMRKKCENIPVLVTAIQQKCPDLSAEAIINHETWYKHYQTLRERQKLAVKEWREQKESEKKKSFEATDKETENHKKKDRPIKIEEETKVDILKKSKAYRTKSRSTNSSANSEKSEKKELIKKWKTEKENKRSMDEEQVKMQMKLKKEMEENRRKKRREKIQEALEEYKKKKSLENTLREENEHSREKCKYDATLLKAFRKQDEEFTQKRKDLISRKKKRSKSETVDVKRVELLQSRDHTTLFDTTEVWREKCRSEDFTRHFNEFQYIKDIPRTCVRWRNEESEDLKI
ncbi:hypothetical protein ANTQUA_LOCUS2537 [Anthophora quadrimaculata]